MGRRKPVWLQKREYDVAKAREQYYENRTPSQSTTVRKRPTTQVVYGSYLIKSGGTSALFNLSASKSSIEFFNGVTALGLKLPATVTDPVGNAPRNFIPAKVHAMKGDATPTARITPWGSRVIKYSTSTTGDTQAFYSAPISGGNTSSTYDVVDGKATTLYNGIKSSLGDLDYARFYLTPEEYTNSKN